MAFAILGLAMAAIPDSTRRRIWLLAGLMVLFATGVPGCGSDSSGPGPLSTQTVTAISATGSVIAFAGPGADVTTASPATFRGLPLKLGTITEQ
jgi:hypothetical protein